MRTFRFLVVFHSMAGHKSQGPVSFKPFISQWHCSPEVKSGCICVLRSPGGSHGDGRGPGGSLKGPRTGSENKKLQHWAVNPRRQANLHPCRGRPSPAFPIPLHTLPSLPRLQHRFESPGEKGERGQNPTTSNGGFSSYREDGALRVGGFAPAGRQAQGLGVGHSPRRGPGGGSQPRTVGRGGKGGKRAGDPRGRRAAGRPAPGTPATRRPGPRLPPPLQRGAPPLPVGLKAEAGLRSGLVGGHPRNAPGRPLAARAHTGHCGRVGRGTRLPGPAPARDLCTLGSFQSCLLNSLAP